MTVIGGTAKTLSCSINSRLFQLLCQNYRMCPSIYFGKKKLFLKANCESAHQTVNCADMHLLAKEKGPGWMLLPMAFGVAVMKGPMYFDVIMFNPHAASNRQQCFVATYRRHERIKIRAYEQCVREVEHGSFTPLVMSLSGGCGNAASTCFKRLASMLAEKWDQPYSNIL